MLGRRIDMTRAASILSWPIILVLMLSFQWKMVAQNNSDSVTVPLSNRSKPVQLKVAIGSGSITIEGYEGKDVVVSARRRYGSINSVEKEGTSWKIPMAKTNLHVEEEKNVVTVRAGDSPEARTQDRAMTIDVVIRTPQLTSANAKTTNLGDIVIENLRGDMVASNQNGSVKLNQISGSGIIDVLNGNILATLLFLLRRPDHQTTPVSGH